MAWHEVLGHEKNVERFRKAVALGKLASTFLFVGPAGIGKRTFAMELARALLCDQADDSQLEACGTCTACQQVAARSHPDLLLVARPPDKSLIPVELLIGDREHRMTSGLCHDISLKPYSGKYKIAIIDDVDFLNQEGANSLLKTLEEPPPRSLLILVGTSEQRQLPTIRSRSQVVRFHKLETSQVAQILAAREAVPAEMVSEIARVADGSMERALLFAEEEMLEFRREWLHELSDLLRKTPAARATSLGSFVDQAGKDAPARRARMKHVFEVSAEFYRHLMSRLCNGDPTGDEVIVDATRDAVARWKSGHEGAVACLERCLEAMEQVDANANQATLLECWVDDLQQLTLHGFLQVA